MKITVNGHTEESAFPFPGLHPQIPPEHRRLGSVLVDGKVDRDMLRKRNQYLAGVISLAEFKEALGVIGGVLETHVCIQGFPKPGVFSVKPPGSVGFQVIKYPEGVV